MEIGTRIKELRLKKHLSQEALAGELGVSRQAVTKWEDNSSRPSTSNLLALCEIFGMSLDELVSGEAEQMPAAETGRHTKRKGALLVGSAVLLAGSIAAAAESLKYQPLQDAIGYGDTATGIFVLGTPLWAYLLYGITAVMIAVTAGVFLRAYKKEKRERR